MFSKLKEEDNLLKTIKKQLRKQFKVQTYKENYEKQFQNLVESINKQFEIIVEEIKKYNQNLLKDIENFIRKIFENEYEKKLINLEERVKTLEERIYTILEPKMETSSPSEKKKIIIGTTFYSDSIMRRIIRKYKPINIGLETSRRCLIKLTKLIKILLLLFVHYF